MRVAVIALSLAFAGPAAAGDWPQFRGPNGSAVSDETNLPVKFDRKTGEGVSWSAPLPGRGVSSPVVAGGAVYVTCSSGTRDDRLHVLAFDAATGKPRWHRQLAATGLTYCHPKTCMAAPTPVADASAVYALFATGDLVAFDAAGNQLWYRSIVGDYPTVTNQVGMASSPVLAGDKLIVPMENDGESFLAAVDTRTGRNVWKASRPKGVNWSSPTVREADGRREVLFAGNGGLSAYDADTGNRVWGYVPAAGSIPTPTLVGDLLLHASGGVTAIKLGEKPAEAWKARLSTGMTSPLAYQGRVYAANPTTGQIACADLKSGKVLWQERAKGPFSASPVAADGKLYVINETGTLTVLKLGDTPEVLGVSELSEEGLATPAISGGGLFLRGEKTLIRVGSKGKG
ncbi:MAG: PQQ-binding-like beta-propeller repeat protein [Gemmataceae bacterium]